MYYFCTFSVDGRMRLSHVLSLVGVSCPSRKSGFFSPAFFPPESFYLIFFTKKRSRWNTNYLPRLKYVKVIGAISGGTRWKCSTSCFLNTVVLCRPLPVLRESLNVLYIFCAWEQGIRGMWLKGKEL